MREVFDKAGRITRSAIAALGLAPACVALATTPQPSGCTDISHIPATFDIEYGAAIQSLFVMFSTNPQAGCADCHTTFDGTGYGSGMPAGELNLDPNDTSAASPYANIVNVPSNEVPGLDYVKPGHPELSFLFMKINCDVPGSHERMPLGYTDVFTPDQQALIYDWIALGAPISSTGTIFRGNFEYRGFNQ